MAIVAVQVRMPWTTVSAEGPVSTNTYHFDSGATAPTALNIAPVLAILGGFVESVGAAGSWSSMFDGTYSSHAYNLADAKPRVPFAEAASTFTVGSDTLAPESSINVGYRYARVTGVPSQRGRGTIHYGPLSSNMIGTDGLIPTAVMDGLQTAIEGLRTAIKATIYDWVVGTELHGFQVIEVLRLTNDLGVVRRRDLYQTDKRLITY